MKKILITITLLIALLGVAGCTQADKVSENLSQEADNFNVVRQLTVINCLQGDVLFQMTGKLSIYADTADNQLEVVVEDENGKYQCYVGWWLEEKERKRSCPVWAFHVVEDMDRECYPEEYEYVEI